MEAFYYEALGSFDSVFLLDDSKHVANVIGVLYFQNFEHEDMKKYLESKTKNLHKCRLKLVKKFGLYWFKQMEEAEWNQKKNAIFPLI